MKSFTEYIQIKNVLKLEMDQRFIDSLEQWVEDNDFNYSFPALFQNDPEKTRIVLPMAQDKLGSSILNKIKSLGEINLKKGTVKKGKNDFRIGKVLLDVNSGFNEEEKRWWKTQANPIDSLDKVANSNKYSIVISREPIDILRMADHKDIKSCHSQGGLFFKCAISEAKNKGAVAFVVLNDDLSKINLEDKEIFKDSQRDIDGIVPLSRIRLRKFVNKKDGYELAVPEKKFYGQEFPDFLNSLTGYALDNQQEVLDGKRPRMEDFKLFGGSHQDTDAGDMFNNLFKDDLDVGGLNAEDDDDDESNLADIWQTELDDVKEKYQNQLQICSFYAEAEEYDGGAYISFNSSLHFNFPMASVNYIPNYNDANFKTSMKNWSRGNDVSYNEVEVDSYNNEFTIRFDLSYDSVNNPDDVDDYVKNVLLDYEKNAEELKAGLFLELTKIGILKPTISSKFINYQENHPQYNNFNVEINYNELDVTTKIPIFLFEKSQINQEQLKKISLDDTFIKKFNNDLLIQLKQWSLRYHQMANQQKTLFPDIQPNKMPFTGEFKIVPNVTLDNRSYYANKIALKFEITIKAFGNDNEIQDAFDFIEFVDNNFEKFNKIIFQIFKDDISKI